MPANEIHVKLIAEALNLPLSGVRQTINLLDEGSTVPFISRYRKEMTGSLDEVEITSIRDMSQRYQDIDKRRESILKSIEEQGHLTPELKQKINAVWTMTELEDLYLPYKPKRKTRASKARELGLEPLAKLIMAQFERDPESKALAFLKDGVEDVDAALAGARDIIAEWVSEAAPARDRVRRIFEKEAVLSAKVIRDKEAAGINYRDYFDFTRKLRTVQSYQMLAIRRAEAEGILRVDIAPDEELTVEQLNRMFVKGHGPCSEQVEMAVKDSYKRLIHPSIETEFRLLSKDKADVEAIQVFTTNLRQLMLASPLGEKTVLALDPGFRTGCKVVCLSAQGDLLEDTVIYPHQPQNDHYNASNTLSHLAQRFNIQAVAIGNGTASRETEQFVRALFKGSPIEIFVVSESGASIYSASDVAREEFPKHDVTVRGAISIGRRLMDPLAELVKIDAKSIGVGQYQHDVDQKKLKESLDDTVVSCVNAVGVNLNTASKHLLTYVSGLGPVLAQNIVQYRLENGPFKSRKELTKVPRLGDKAFEQCAGFLRIREAQNPLDASAVHPESYGIVAQMAKDLGCKIEDLMQKAELRKQIDLKRYVNDKVGLPTLKDIIKELEKPGLDPREQITAFSFDEHVKTIGDLREGMKIPGIVTNITAFGAFVDIGIKENGLIHKSQIANKFVENPADHLKLNQQLIVRVVSIDFERGRVQLSLKD